MRNLLGLLCVCLLATLCQAVNCNCNNGHTISTDTCECTCKAGYLPPTCTFGLWDVVEVIFYMNRTADDFSSELFTNAVSYAASGTNISFKRAANISQFDAMTCTVTVVGYAVQRVLDSVTYRDPWVEEYAIIAAYPVVPSTLGSGGLSDFGVDTNLYSEGNVVITANGVVWVVMSVVIVLLLAGSDYMLLSNTDETVQPKNLKHRKSTRRMSVKNLKAAADEPAEIVVNLNEHRRPVNTKLSMPMQILDDFVDSSDDEYMGEEEKKKKAAEKYSLGMKVEKPTGKGKKPEGK